MARNLPLRKFDFFLNHWYLCFINKKQGLVVMDNKKTGILSRHDLGSSYAAFVMLVKKSGQHGERDSHEAFWEFQRALYDDHISPTGFTSKDKPEEDLSAEFAERIPGDVNPDSLNPKRLEFSLTNLDRDISTASWSFNGEDVKGYWVDHFRYPKNLADFLDLYEDEHQKSKFIDWFVGNALSDRDWVRDNPQDVQSLLGVVIDGYIVSQAKREKTAIRNTNGYFENFLRGAEDNPLLLQAFSETLSTHETGINVLECAVEVTVPDQWIRSVGDLLVQQMDAEDAFDGAHKGMITLYTQLARASAAKAVSELAAGNVYETSFSRQFIGRILELNETEGLDRAAALYITGAVMAQEQDSMVVRAADYLDEQDYSNNRQKNNPSLLFLEHLQEYGELHPALEKANMMPLYQGYYAAQFEDDPSLPQLFTQGDIEAVLTSNVAATISDRAQQQAQKYSNLLAAHVMAATVAPALMDTREPTAGQISDQGGDDSMPFADVAGPTDIVAVGGAGTAVGTAKADAFSAHMQKAAGAELSNPFAAMEAMVEAMKAKRSAETSADAEAGASTEEAPEA